MKHVIHWTCQDLSILTDMAESTALTLGAISWIPSTSNICLIGQISHNWSNIWRIIKIFSMYGKVFSIMFFFRVIPDCEAHHLVFSIFNLSSLKCCCIDHFQYFVIWNPKCSRMISFPNLYSWFAELLKSILLKPASTFGQTVSLTGYLVLLSGFRVTFDVYIYLVAKLDLNLINEEVVIIWQTGRKRDTWKVFTKLSCYTIAQTCIDPLFLWIEQRKLRKENMHFAVLALSLSQIFVTKYLQ